MMKTLLFSLFFSLPLLSFGQRAFESVPVQERTVKTNPLSLQKLVRDTIAPAILYDTCGQNLALYRAPTEVGGYVFGTNGYNDLYKLQRFVYPSDSPFLVTEVQVAFAAFDSTIRDQYIAIEIYNNLNADSSFGSFLGVSDSVRVGDLLVSNSGLPLTTFTFPTPVTVENDSFFVAIDFTDTYRSDTTGYVGVYSTRDSCGDGRNVLEIFPVQNGLGFGSVFVDWEGLNAEMFMIAVVDTDVNTSTRNTLADYAAMVAPNPTFGYLTISFEALISGDYRSTLTDLNGRTLRNNSARSVAGTARTEWDISDLPTGLYLYHIDGPAGRQSGKVIKR